MRNVCGWLLVLAMWVGIFALVASCDRDDEHPTSPVVVRDTVYVQTPCPCECPDDDDKGPR